MGVTVALVIVTLFALTASWSDGRQNPAPPVTLEPINGLLAVGAAKPSSTPAASSVARTAAFFGWLTSMVFIPGRFKSMYLSQQVGITPIKLASASGR